ncbi:Ycf66 family protein [Acaryochloris sp. IP29b_bin.148]|uniref:Ycf66 family protein n=1 Tax=Acaryochloris sp. IP29b_bin.148 TaxID=2969218 RepID=UPI00261C117F|nr:Ycf66 family protein [Acaryochloris sp. IP29b_bin.148]
MLSVALVLIVGLGSIGLYLTAYVYPEIHRKTDIWWSGTGLFYALILLIYRRPLGLLLGHTASVVLLVWLSYQALQRRWAMVEANPPQPEAGTLSAKARAVMDQVIAKVASVDWQGLWQRMGTQANDGTSETSILPPALKQRLSGLGDQLKGMIGGQDRTEATPPVETVQPSKETLVDPPPAQVAQETAAQETKESLSKADPASAAPVTIETATTPPASAPPEMPLPVADKTTPEEHPHPDPQMPTAVSTESQDTPVMGPTAEPQTIDPPDATKAELKAELDQVISNLSSEEQESPPNLPQPPDPLG